VSDKLSLAVGFALGVGLLPILWFVFRNTTVWVEDGEAVLVTRFGKLVSTLKKPGLHFLAGRAFPWVGMHVVSLKRDFRHFQDVHVNDSRGTTVIVDLWLEVRVDEPEKALFHVADWNASLQNLVSHAATSILGNREFKEILCDRTELATILQRDIGQETTRWGVKVELVFIRNVSLLPEVSRQIFETIAARLERAKADVDEAGRLAVAELDAQTSLRVASLVAEAKGQYPLAIGRALGRLKAEPEVFIAYNELYELSLVRPHRTVAFRGFCDGELRAVDAAMLPTDPGQTALPASGASTGPRSTT
jgi:regulator of protease activity HflC (stomatin/prohibitin superfamily)